MPNKEQHKGIIERKQEKTNEDLNKGTNYLLVIGIDQYQHCTPLYNAVKDATDFIDVLIERYNFDKEHLIFIKDKDANKDNIIDAFRQLKKQINPPDNLIIYYSGHGEVDDDFSESYLVTVDSRKGKIGDYLSHEQMVKFIRAIKTHHTLLILDACFAGAFLVERRATKALEKDPSRYVIASGRKEYASDGIAGTNSPFAAALLEKLRQNEDSLLVSDLAQYAMIQTIKATRETQRPIHNPLQVKEDKGGQFVFHPKNLEAPKQIKEAPTAWEQKLKALELEIARLKENQQPTQQRIINPTPHFIKDPNTLTDPRDGQTYKTVKLKDGKIWMTQNLNFDIGEGSWIYEDDPKNGEQYGRLYTWEAAQKACPDGWHVPSDEEWQVMSKLYGGHYRDSSDKGKSTYKALIKGGSFGFSALLGGYRHSNGVFDYLGDGGYYWSSTENDTFYAWSYGFYRYTQKLNRGNGYKSWAFSCRCVQD